MPPNLILIVMDTARADAFEPYGANPGSTPAVAQLASRGAAIPGVFAPASWTIPSHVSMFSGELPRAVGLAQAPSGTPASCRPTLESLKQRLLPEVLRRAGYSTVGVSTNLWITDQSGFANGFDNFHVISTSRNHRVNDRTLRSRLSWDLECARARVDDGANAAETVINRYLDESPDQPFFWFVNLNECHSPYLPPRPYNDLPILERLRAAEDARRHLNLVAIWRACLGDYSIDADAIDRMRYLYERSVRAMDDWLARLLNRLDARHLLDDTIVIVTSDHGENLGEGGLMGHAFSLDDRLIRVPLVVSQPDAFPSGNLKSLVDLPRMVAEMLGLQHHPWSNGTERDGIAIAQLDTLAPPSDPRASSFVTDWGLGEEAFRRLTTSATCATDGRLKVLRRDQDELVYDLADDPLEIAPTRAPSSSTDGLAPAVAKLRAAIELVDDAPTLVGAREPAASDSVPTDEAEQIANQMRLLGYL